MSKLEFAAEHALEEKPLEFAAAKSDAFAEKDVDLADEAEIEARRRAEAQEAKWLESARQVFGTPGTDYLEGHRNDPNLLVGMGTAKSETGDADTMMGGAASDRIYGGDGRDYVEAGDGDDVVWTAADDDQLFAGLGDDLAGGDDGNDLIGGDQGNDTLWGGADDDMLFGQDGDDLLGGDAGFRDILFGGAGNDRLFDSDGVKYMDGEEGDDILAVTAGPGWGLGENLGAIYGGDGNDSIFLYGNDAKLNWGVVAGDEPSPSKGDGDDYVEMNGLYAGSSAFMGGGNDYFKGGAGSDTVDGGTGHDWLDGGAGDDRLTGGEGWDRFIFASGSGRDTIADFEDGIDVVDLSGYRGAKGEGLSFADLKVSSS
ncbi:MAG: calcium-binding protein, partial [Tagaea sp.]